MAQDLRDAEGLTRPLLRRAALRLSVSPRTQLRQLGCAYLRLDPPAPDAITARPSAVERAPARPLGLPAPNDGAAPSATGVV